MTLEVGLLGAPHVTRDGVGLAFDTRKAVALLAYLGERDRPVQRETLIAALWPEAERERGGAALRRTLSTIRSVTGAGTLVTAGPAVALADDVTVDVRRMRALIGATRSHAHSQTDVCPDCRELLTEAVALHRGRFLEGFVLRDSVEFEEWAFAIADQLHREVADALARLVDACVLTGDLAAAVEAGNRRVALEPLSEPAHRSLMRVHGWHGRREEAIRQYRVCVRVLDAELGVAPLAETTRLYEEIVAGRLAPPSQTAGLTAPAAPAASPAPRSPSEPAPSRAAPVAVSSGDRRLARRLVPAGAPEASDRGTAAGQPATSASPVTSRRTRFVGRSTELERLRAAVSAISDDGAVIVIEGEAGIGKTRLVDELLADPALTGHEVLCSACRESESTLAYGVVIEALRRARTVVRTNRSALQALPVEVRGELSRLLPELTSDERPHAAEGPASAWRLLDALATALAATVAGAQPGLLVLEDAQWMDESSLDVLGHLARRLRGRPLGLVLTWRPEQAGPGSRLRRLVTDAARDATVTEVALERLPEAAVRGLVGDWIADEGTAARVVDAAEGVPLLVVEYVAAIALDPAALDGPLPRGARNLFAARMAAVGPAARQVLATAAVLGVPFDPDLVREASGREDEEAAEALEELVAAGLIGETSAGGGLAYAFTHARLRALTYEELGLARRRLLHRRVAAVLEGRARRTRTEGAAAATIVVHARAAGDETAAARWAAVAGDHAAGLLAVTEAAAHYEDALALGHPERTRLTTALGDLATLAGRYADAVARYEAAAALAQEDDFPAVEHRLAAVHLRRGDWVLADQHLHVALAALEGRSAPADLGLTARIRTDRGLLAHRQGRPDEAVTEAQLALGAAQEAGDPAALAAAHNLLGVLSKGNLPEARHHLEQALALARRLHDVGTEVAAANNLAQAHAAAGDPERALLLAESAAVRAKVLGDRHRLAALENHLADLLRALGRDEEAMEHLKRAVTLFAEVDEPGAPSPEIWKLAEW